MSLFCIIQLQISLGFSSFLHHFTEVKKRKSLEWLANNQLLTTSFTETDNNKKNIKMATLLK